MKLNIPKESIEISGHRFWPEEVESHIYTATKCQTCAFRLLYKSAEHYGLVVETGPRDASERSLELVRLEAEKLLSRQPALCVALGRLAPASQGDADLSRNELRVAALNATFDPQECEYVLTAFGQGINPEELRRPMPPSCLEAAAIRLEARLERQAAVQAPKTARGVERWIREQLAASHQVAAESAQRAVTLEEVGLGSLGQMTLLEELELAFGLPIPHTATWETGTIQRLAELVFRLLKEKS